ncbi:MAG: peptidoglycan editing factor PgeF [Armatimonadetes bacterium]|nr:peptidoglycan editing factor PgeF [Armatimonadota bacterium]
MTYELREVDTGETVVTFVRFSNLAVPHGFSTRLGGVSQGVFASMNLGRTAGDDPDLVTANRHLFARATGVEVPTTLRMEHGSRVAVLREPNGGLKLGDACTSDRPDTPMAITTADCVPVLFHDPVTGAVALAHAGWRGTVAGVVAETVKAMRAEYGTRPEDLRAALAPAIGPCCFLVDEDVAVRFEQRFPESDLVRCQGAKWSVDLWEANRLLLIEAGVPVRQIDTCPLCTSCRSDLFFSYRRDRKRTGRMAAVIRAS